MTRPSTFLLAMSAAAFLAACGGSPPAATPAPEAVPDVTVRPAADEGLSDARAMELGRRYVALLHARDYDALWQHVTPEGQQRFGTLDRFRSEGERVLSGLGAETSVVSEGVEPARAGIPADKLYLRVAQYAGAEGGPVRLMMALTNDGSIAGLQVRRPD
ncbi:MAG: hypothetical protein KY467_01420 [Gemmatimonadetes bacterium]|nr:hypothetical protein [Gemmatimonadota bacterium]